MRKGLKAAVQKTEIGIPVWAGLNCHFREGNGPGPQNEHPRDSGIPKPLGMLTPMTNFAAMPSFVVFGV
jgi:hypothetical protein